MGWSSRLTAVAMAAESGAGHFGCLVGQSGSREVRGAASDLVQSIAGHRGG